MENPIRVRGKRRGPGRRKKKAGKSQEGRIGSRRREVEAQHYSTQHSKLKTHPSKLIPQNYPSPLTLINNKQPIAKTNL
jgi:hypothetical protein